MSNLESLEERVVTHIEEHKSEHIEFLQELIQAKPINPPGSEERIAKLLRPKLKSLGFEVEEYTEIEGRPNLVARLEGGDGPTLLMTAHMDVVPARNLDNWPCDPYSGDIVDGRLYGRGSCDHKSPIVAMLGAIEALQANNVTLDGDLIFVFDSNEEKGGEHGMKYVVENADIDADMGIYAVTTSLTDEAVEYFPTLGKDNIQRANFGNQVFEVTIEGHLEHPLAPAETEGAGERLSQLLPKIQSYCDEIGTRQAPLVGDLDAQITTIESEGRKGRASREIRVYLRRYYAPEEEGKAVYREFEENVKQVAGELGLSDAVSVDRTQNMPNVVVPEDHTLVQSTRRASQLVREQDPTITGVPAQTGITWIVKQLEIPMILFGYGNVNLHHAEPEWIEPGDVIDTTKAYALTYMDALGATTNT